MGRHSTGKNNYSLSKELIALIVAILLLLAAGAAWLFLRSNSSEDSSAASGDQQECVAGDLSLPIAAANKAVGEKLISDYAASDPVVRDYCVTPTYEPDVKQAAVYVAPDSAITEDELSAARRSAATNEPPAVYSTPVGYSHSGETEADAPDVDDILFPTSEQPEAAAIVAATLADSDEDAAAALTSQRTRTTAEAASKQAKIVATAEDSAPEGLTFTPIDGAELVYNAIPLNTSDTVNEEQTRAAQAFADYAGKTFLDSHGEMQETTSISDTVWAAAKPEGGARIADPGEATSNAKSADTGTTQIEATTTLFLLDTSAAMSEYNDSAADVLDGAIGELTGAGHSVALWNYSSPLTAGVNKGYRANVAFTTDSDKLTGTAHRFINDGEPLTREAVSAAVDYAESEASPEKPVRIVLITSGTADSGNDYPTRALAEAKDKGVSLTIVQVGANGTDEALAEAAEFTTDATNADALGPAIRKAAGLD